MRSTLLLLFTITFTNALGQYINGPANIRDKPNGNRLFSVSDSVKIVVDKKQEINGWHQIELMCYVESDRILDKQFIKASTTLLTINGDSIGHTFAQFRLDENFNELSDKYKELGKIYISLKGYTHKSNLRQEKSNQDLIDSRLTYSDSCQTKYKIIQEAGWAVTIVDKCNIYATSILNSDTYQNVIIRERQRIRRISGGEGQDSQIDLEIVEGYTGENRHVRRFSAKADKIEIQGRVINVVQYGCCAGEDTYQLYNAKTLNKIMEYNTALYHLRIPNSKIEGFIGYQPKYQDNRDGVIGTLSFTDGEVVINTINFITKDKQKFANILRYVPDMEFIPINPKDKVLDDKKSIDLWSKNFSKSSKDLSDFRFLVHLTDESTGKTYTQEITFSNGRVNGNQRKEFDISID